MSTLYYSEEHEWLSVEGDIATIGITDHAQAQLGDMVFVELPEIGAELSALSESAVVESVKAASDIYSPVSGEVVAVNDNLEETPELVNEDPYGDGWMFRVMPQNVDQLADLLDAEAYAAVAEED